MSTASTYILGLSAFFHDSAACLLRDGVVIAAAQEERFSRIKYDASFPRASIQFCLRQAGIALRDVAHVVYYEKPFVKFDRLLETHLDTAPRGLWQFTRGMPRWLTQHLFLRTHLGRLLSSLDEAWSGDGERLLFCEHHLSHAAAAFYGSTLRRATVVTADGVGEWATTTVGIADEKGIELTQEIRFPHSLGLVYSAFTEYAGFRVNADEYKLMGLAPYGEPRYAQAIRDHLLELRDDGSFAVNTEYFGYVSGRRMTGPKFEGLFGGRPRKPGEPLAQRHADLARSIQSVTEEAMRRLVRAAIAATGCNDVCLSGGVALNCVANGQLMQDPAIGRIHVPSAPGDAGGAIGAAMAAWHMFLQQPRTVGTLPQSPFLGPAFEAAAVEAALREAGLPYERLPDNVLLPRVARLLADGAVVGWYSGAMEFGPRALGARSILADPRDPAMRDRINRKIKQRESFRPFAPAIRAARAAEYYDLSSPSPYMSLAAPLRPPHLRAAVPQARSLSLDPSAASALPAVTHVDGSARVQTVDAEISPRFHALLSAFEQQTGCPMLLNTSFNTAEEPIVCTPAEAAATYRRAGLDALVMDDALVVRG